MIEKSDPVVSIVVPVHNNATTLEALAAQIDAVCESCCDGQFELILVDDGSDDDSWVTIEGLSSDRIFGLRLSRNFGQNAALKAGFSHCRGQFIVMMDADFDDDPALISSIVERLREGIDICFTVAEKKDSSSVRFTSRLFHRFTNNKNLVLANRTPSTMRGFNNRVLDAILRYGERRPVYGPLITGLGFRQGFIAQTRPRNPDTKSSYNLSKRLRLAIDYLIGYTNIAAGFFLFAGVFASLGSLTYAGIIIVQYLVFDVKLPPGLSLLVLLLLSLFAVLYFGIGIIGLYLQRLLNESLQRPLYFISETVGGGGTPT